MSDGDYCPILKEKCIKDKCHLYQAIPIVSPGPVAGTVKQALMRGCTFNLTSFLLARLELAMPPPAPGRSLRH